jgi:uncharacterized repeat protein (TIGR01451 family)
VSASPASVRVGQQLIYHVAVSNRGRATAQAVNVGATINGSATLGSSYLAEATCTQTATVTCSPISLAPGKIATLRIVVVPTQAGELVNVATASVGGVEVQSSMKTTVLPASAPLPGAPAGPPDLSVRLSSSARTARVGDQLVYHVSVGNRGRGIARGVSVSAALSGPATVVSSYAAGATGCSGTATVVCSFDSIAPGGVATVRIVAAPSQQGTVVLAAAPRRRATRTPRTTRRRPRPPSSRRAAPAPRPPPDPTSPSGWT